MTLNSSSGKRVIVDGDFVDASLPAERNPALSDPERTGARVDGSSLPFLGGNRPRRADDHSVQIDADGVSIVHASDVMELRSVTDSGGRNSHSDVQIVDEKVEDTGIPIEAVPIVPVGGALGDN